MLFSKLFKSNLLSFDTFSKFEITPLQYFNGYSPFVLTKIKTILIQVSFINFSKFHEFGFFKSKFSAKSSIFPYIFHTKMAILYTQIAPVSLQLRWGIVFSHKYTRNTMTITNATIKKIHGAVFLKPQPARASLNLVGRLT